MALWNFPRCRLLLVCMVLSVLIRRSVAPPDPTPTPTPATQQSNGFEILTGVLGSNSSSILFDVPCWHQSARRAGQARINLANGTTAHIQFPSNCASYNAEINHLTGKTEFLTYIKGTYSPVGGTLVIKGSNATLWRKLEVPANSPVESWDLFKLSDSDLAFTNHSSSSTLELQFTFIPERKLAWSRSPASGQQLAASHRRQNLVSFSVEYIALLAPRNGSDQAMLSLSDAFFETSDESMKYCPSLRSFIPADLCGSRKSDYLGCPKFYPPSPLLNQPEMERTCFSTSESFIMFHAMVNQKTTTPSVPSATATGGAVVNTTSQGTTQNTRFPDWIWDWVYATQPPTVFSYTWKPPSYVYPTSPSNYSRGNNSVTIALICCGVAFVIGVIGVFLRCKYYGLRRPPTLLEWMLADSINSATRANANQQGGSPVAEVPSAVQGTSVNVAPVRIPNPVRADFPPTYNELFKEHTESDGKGATSLS